MEVKFKGDSRDSRVLVGASCSKICNGENIEGPSLTSGGRSRTHRHQGERQRVQENAQPQKGRVGRLLVRRSFKGWSVSLPDDRVSALPRKTNPLFALHPANVTDRFVRFSNRCKTFGFSLDQFSRFLSYSFFLSLKPSSILFQSAIRWFYPLMCYNPRWVGKSPPPIDRRHWPVRFSHFCSFFFIPTVFTLDPVSFSIRSRSLFSSCAALHDSRPIFVVVNQLRSKKGHYSVALCQSKW